jgi:hypothetical protein
MVLLHWSRTSRLSVDDVCNPSIGRLKITLAFLDAMPDRVTVEPANVDDSVLRPEKPNCSSPSSAPVKAMRISETESEIRPRTRATRSTAPAENDDAADDAETDATAPLVDQSSEMSATSTVSRKLSRPLSPSSSSSPPQPTLQRQALTESWSAVRDHLFVHWARLTRQARPLVLRSRAALPRT